MIDNQHVRSQRLVVLVTKDGHTKKTLVVATDLDPRAGAQFNKLVSDAAAYLKRHDLDEVEIDFRQEIS